jgi:hypothetical protein
MKSTHLTAHTRSAPNGNGRVEVAYPLHSQILADVGGTRIVDEGDGQDANAKPDLGH